jgi:elongator complex protein 2
MPTNADGTKSWSLGCTVKLDEGACAVDSTPIGDGRELLAVGTESGKVWLYEVQVAGEAGVQEKLLQKLDDR